MAIIHFLQHVLMEENTCNSEILKRKVSVLLILKTVPISGFGHVTSMMFPTPISVYTATNLVVNGYHKVNHLIIAAVNAIPEPYSGNDDVIAELHRPPRIWFFTGVGKCAGIPIDCLCSWVWRWKILRALCNQFVVLRNVDMWARNIGRPHWKTKQTKLSLCFLSDSPWAGLLSQTYHLESYVSLSKKRLTKASIRLCVSADTLSLFDYG